MTRIQCLVAIPPTCAVLLRLSLFSVESPLPRLRLLRTPTRLTLPFRLRSR
ncbi:hypothetical protein PR003_g19503 [Phytophthora rubi]|uniref:RxLR effector protein n=1 Tax=Phytophthora rubi TaxID=129364 RepID=A0A6A3KBQ7_9STRA|nr:hypothetical protein PR002_g18856 [Phytophthora rubi]KAE9002135.1 hypothetical protein PR001_g18340 [Phytophthora rubi]KAE9313421.1 hypothetical protein PR003_g19503 [Phytophthora rubi]